MAGRDLFASDNAPKGRNLFAEPQPTPTAQPDQELSWSDVPMQAFSNIPSSAAQFAQDMATPFMEPVETAKALGNVGLGAIQKLIPGEQSSEKYADMVGQFIEDRYGSEDAFKNTIAKDPVGVLADFSTVLTGGGALAARAPGMAGKAGNIAKSAGLSIDPVNIAAKGASIANNRIAAPVTKTVLGTLTGAGGQAVGEAYKAGQSRSRQAQAFTDQMRGIAPVEDVVTSAKSALNEMKQQRAAQYRSGMGDVKARQEVIDFKPIDKAVSKVLETGQFKGQTIRPKAAGAMQEVFEAVENWKSLDPSEYHTPEGLDALKQQIYDIGSSYDPMTQKQARMVADQVYNSIKSEIVKQAPEYAKVMKDYEQASELINDIEKTLSVNPKANVDTTVRKLQSVMRNNANTNYGRRENLARELESMGATELFPALSGQAMSSPAPRGLQGAGTALSGLGIGAGIMSGGVSPLALSLLPLTSPRAVGELSYYTGRGADLAKRAAQNVAPAVSYGPRMGAVYSGRLTQELQE